MEWSKALIGCGPAAEWDTPRSNSSRTLGGLPTTEMRPSEEDEEGEPSLRALGSSNETDGILVALGETPDAADH